MILALILIFSPFVILLLLEAIKQKTRPVLDEEPLDSSELKEKVYQSFLRMIHAGKLDLPRGYIFSNGHVWSKVMPNGEMQIGIDDFLLKLLGKIDKIELNDAGESVNKNGKMCVIRIGSKSIAISSPLEGTITETNRKILNSCEIINNSPYGAGWLYRVKPSLDFSHTEKSFHIGHSALDWIQNEMETLSSYIVSEFPSSSKLEELFQEREIPLVGILQRMDKSSLSKFEENFLR